MEKVIEINDLKYKLVKEYKDGFDMEEFEKLFTDYFYNYDYIFGDWAYSKLRLKGFNKSDSKNVNKINDIANLDKYIETNCAYDCRHFLLEKVDE